MLTETDLKREAARLVDREVHCCLSSLVATLAQSSGRSCEACDPIGELAEQAFELSSPVDDYEEAATQAGWTFAPSVNGTIEGRSSEWRPARKGFIGSGETYLTGKATIAKAAERICVQHGIEPYQREVFEHWAISDWLADKLIAKGEKVDRDFANLTVWARTTSGQAISMDRKDSESPRSWTPYPKAAGVKIVDADTFDLALGCDAHFVRLRFVNS